MQIHVFFSWQLLLLLMIGWNQIQTSWLGIREMLNILRNFVPRSNYIQHMVLPCASNEIGLAQNSGRDSMVQSRYNCTLKNNQWFCPEISCAQDKVFSPYISEVTSTVQFPRAGLSGPLGKVFGIFYNSTTTNNKMNQPWSHSTHVFYRVHVGPLKIHVIERPTLALAFTVFYHWSETEIRICGPWLNFSCLFIFINGCNSSDYHFFSRYSPDTPRP